MCTTVTECVLVDVGGRAARGWLVSAPAAGKSVGTHARTGHDNCLGSSCSVRARERERERESEFGLYLRGWSLFTGGVE